MPSLAELLGAPIYAGYASEVNVASDHPLNCGALPNTSATAPRITTDLLGRHDVVLAVGTPLFRFVFPRPESLVPAGTTVTLTATPARGAVIGWTGCDSDSGAGRRSSCTVTMTGDRSVSATFAGRPSRAPLP